MHPISLLIPLSAGKKPKGGVQLRAEKELARGIIAQFSLFNYAVRATIVSFESTPTTQIGLSTDRGAVNAAISAITTTSGGTDISAALNTAKSNFAASPRATARKTPGSVRADARGRRMHAHGVFVARFRRGGARNEEYEVIEGSAKLCVSRAVEVGHRAPPPEPTPRPQPSAAEACREFRARGVQEIALIVP